MTKHAKIFLLILTMVFVLIGIGCEIPNHDGYAENLSDEERNAHRPDYDLGTCTRLSGTVGVAIFYIDDFESSWEENEMHRFTEYEIKPGLDYLEQQAKQYDVLLHFEITDVFKSVPYDHEVITSTKETGFATIDVAYWAAVHSGYSSDRSFHKEICDRENMTNVIILTVFNKNGTSYAINPKRDADPNVKIAEHCILFARDLSAGTDQPNGYQSAVVAHEILHLFGAEDFYHPTRRKNLARWYYPDDIMLEARYDLEKNDLGAATAFYIGWTDRLPCAILHEDWNA